MTTKAAPPTTRDGSAAPAGPAPAAGGDSGLSHRQILTILGGLMAGMFLAALDQTIVASAIRTIGDDLNGLSAQAWVTTAYLITSTITTPLYGKLSDIYGRRPFFLLAISIFVVGSLISAFATSMYELAAFRAFQGLGAGGLFSLALTILGDIVPPRQRAKYQGYFLAVFGTSSVLGPVIGGFLSGQDEILGIAGWKYVFLVNVPIGIVAFAVVWRVLHIPHVSRPHKIDWQGAIALVVALVPLLTVAEQGRTWGWGNGKSIAAYVLAVVGVALFLVAERRAGEDALIPLRFFRNSTFRLVTGVNVLVGAAMFGGLSLLPLYLQIVKGKSPTQSGLLLLPLTAGIMIGSIVSGQITSRTGRYKIFPVIGTAVMTVAFVLMWLVIDADTSLVGLSFLMAMFGLGLGNILQSTILAIQNASAPREIGVATSSATFFRQIGATLGTAVFLSILYSTVTDNILGQYRTAAGSLQSVIADPAVTAVPGNQILVGIARAASSGQALPAATANGALNDTAFLKAADPTLAHPFFAGFAQSMSLVFLISAFVLAIGFVIVLFLKETPLRTQSGLDAARSEAAASAESAGQAPPATAGIAAAPVVTSTEDALAMTSTAPTPGTHRGAGPTVVGTTGDGSDNGSDSGSTGGRTEIPGESSNGNGPDESGASVPANARTDASVAPPVLGSSAVASTAVVSAPPSGGRHRRHVSTVEMDIAEPVGTATH